MLSLNNIDISS